MTVGFHKRVDTQFFIHGHFNAFDFVELVKALLSSEHLPEEVLGDKVRWWQVSLDYRLVTRGTGLTFVPEVVVEVILTTEASVENLGFNVPQRTLFLIVCHFNV